MDHILRTTLVISLALFTLSACAGALHPQATQPQDTIIPPYQAKPLTLSGNWFADALAQAYHHFAESNAAKVEWLNEDFYYNKSLRAAQGIHIDPEQPEDWNIPHTSLPDLKKARQLLLDNVQGDLIKQAPRPSAQAYVYYDCWVEEAQQTTSTIYDQSCRERFFETLNTLSVIEKPSTPTEEDTTQTKGSGALPPGFTPVTGTMEAPKGTTPPSNASATNSVPSITDNKTTTTSTNASPGTAEPPKSQIILFPFDSARINQTGDATLQRLVDEAKGRTSPYTITINGHTDRSGSEQYNLTLSWRRGNTIKDTLVTMGIPEGNIQVFGFGESDPAVETADGERHPANRRAEIVIE